MPTATVSFDLSDPDEEREHRCALAGKDALIALEKIDLWAREQVKYGSVDKQAKELLTFLRQHLIPHDLTSLLE